MHISYMNDIPALAEFLYQLNQDNKHHVGYIRLTKQSIIEQLHNIQPKDMLQITDNGQIIAAFGIEHINENEAFILGPITTKTDSEALNMIQVMWQDFLRDHPDITTYYFSFHEAHRFGQKVMKHLRTQYLGTTYTMEATENKTSNIAPQIIKYKPIYKKSFTQLMKDLQTDYKTMRNKILSTVGLTHELYLYINEGLAKAYIWIQINDEDVCNIEYLATHPQYRNKGIGHELVSFAVNHAFHKHHAQRIQISVKSKREKNIAFYEAIGFKKINEMNHFKYTVK
ncbi:GNAT family N-acetyltransferase [Macrococcoides caseolyticum]|uniref:GNAT family N-acetyltransferase n=1 Tax=Macrococcoides caseolyticum TaxID=69966 RepID=UPI001F1C33D8|nr:GNAT family N-acetyltransferase [Macrococcus caseolyticus]MCE4957877.1 GNAT family N-acetyltransferase [Macrococcus caseolyticus]